MSREEELFHAALALPPNKREAFLEKHCQSDEMLRQRLKGLIASHQHSGSFLEEAPFTQIGEPLSTTGTQQYEESSDTSTGYVGASIGRYKLIEQIGEGGFGIVYMAQQETPVRRQVALKIIKLGMDTKQVIGRFEAERQALAIMEHPNIAKVLDAGETETGRPYFVMELVRGLPITGFCDHNKLSTHDRLRLFADVCRAIQHAHQKGIIHRDIKPTNVIVAWNEDLPIPKVIDFGVAKATQHRLTELSIFTQYAQMIGTPTYMSPEQAKLSTDIDTRSDVYSLGVLLYELLTGAPPFTPQQLLEHGYDEMQRQICDVEVPKPSARMNAMTHVDLFRVAKLRKAAPDKLSRMVRGELDWIVMKSLEKDRHRRYSTAASLADDVQRFLCGDAVEAAAPSAWYRLRKFALRNRVAVITTTVVAMALLVGTIVSSVGLLEAHQAQSQMQETQEQLKTQFEESEAARQQADLNLYVAEINRGFQAYEDGNLNFAKTLLIGHESSYGDRFEWRLLHRMCETSDALHTFREHSDRVTSVAVSQHGVIASGSDDRTFRLFDLNQRKQIAYRSVDNKIIGVRFSPDGHVLAVLEKNKEISFWNVVLLKKIGRLTSDQLGEGGGQFDVEFLDNATIAVKRGQRVTPVQLWKWRTPIVPPIQIKDPRGWFISFSRNGDMMSTVGNGFSLWRRGADDTYERSAWLLNPHTRAVDETIFSPDAKYLASRDAIDVRIWDTKSLGDADVEKSLEEPIARLQTSVACFAYSPDSRYMAIGNRSGNVEIWSATPSPSPIARPLSTLRGHSDAVRSIAYSRNGRAIVTGSSDHTVCIWSGQIPATRRDSMNCTDWMYEVDFSPDGKLLAAGGFDGRVTVYESESMEKVFDEKRHDLNIFNVAFSPDGEWLASCVGWWRSIPESAENRGWVSVVNLRNRQESHYVDGLDDPDEVRAIHFAPHENLLAIGDYRGLVRIWDVENRKHLVNCNAKAAVRNVRFSPNGGLLAVATFSGLELRNSKTLELIASDGNSSTRTIAFSPNGKTIAYGSGSRIQLLDVPSLKNSGMLQGSKSGVWGIAFSSDGKSLIASENQGGVRIWNLETGRDVVVLSAHRGIASGLAISPDHNVMASSGDDKTIRIWRARPIRVPYKNSR